MLKMYKYFTKKANKLTKEEIAKLFDISRQTLNNWEKTKPELYKIIMEHFKEEQERIYPDLNDPKFLKAEMIKAIEKLPNQKVKKFYHLMMAELADIGA